MTPELQESRLAATAARWVARREAGLSAEERAELQAWLKADARHGAALAQADPQASELDWPLHSGVLDRVLHGLEARASLRRRRRRRLLSGAVAAFVVLSTILPMTWQSGTTPAPTSLVVRRPEIRTLPDGSTLELQDGAEVRIAFTPEARRVELLRGAAHFTVQKDARRPFLVSAGAVTARAVGTSFLVGHETGQIALVVTEGRVALDRSASAVAAEATLVVVQAGESVAVEHTDAATVTATAPRLSTLPAADQQRRLAWRTPRLEFNGTPLSEIVAAVNRHNRTQLALAEASLGSLKVSGALSADRVDALLEMLEADFRLVAERTGERVVLRRGMR